MTRSERPARKTLAGFHDGLTDRLAAAGHGPAAIEALLALDTEMFAWHRQTMKGELALRLLAELGLDLELSQFHALTAIARITHGVGRDRAEPATVGLLAEDLAIDPSRASRIASGLIAAGWVRRDAAQDDGRKTVLLLTDKAHAVFVRFRAAKWEKLIAVFAEWSAEEIETFSRLFARYAEGMGRVYGSDR